MAHSFRQRFLKYCDWRLRKLCQSHGVKNSSVILGLCIGLWLISLGHQPTHPQFDTSSYHTYPIELICTVDKVVDGDTIIARCPQSKEEGKDSLRSIRVWGIDAPESRQAPWGDLSTKTLTELIAGEHALKIKIHEQDRYQRMIGQLYVNELDVGLEMVRRGMAVVYHRYNNDKDYISEEKKAKLLRLGVWQVAGAQQTPEKWRRFNP